MSNLLCLKSYGVPTAIIVDCPLETQRKRKPEGSALPLTLKFTPCRALAWLLLGPVEREEDVGLGGDPAWVGLGPEELPPTCRWGLIVTGRDIGASFCPKAAPARRWGCCDVRGRSALLEDPVLERNRALNIAMGKGKHRALA